jgi:uncharacterized protein YyaL (SSP411 family)
MANRLANETSPYLLQHSNNPVDWFPWGEEALVRARARDVPILLSIGYAACHWCHVMERESFEDDATAKLMNEWFVPVKVDREERPDLDAIYMDAVQAMTGQGGWPMTVFLTPDGAPFYGGTYYPPEDRHGMPGFRRVLEAVHNAWIGRREDISRQGAALVDHISRAVAGGATGGDPTEEVLAGAVRRLRDAFDAEWGGFGPAPKFPQPMTVEFLLRMHARGASGAIEMARRTLDKMARGGLFDQIGGGFHRYSVDRLWLVPHFEKMLYDNAQLLRLYTRAWLVTGSELYRRTALATAGYLLREMRHERGGFYSSQDADSEGVEGKFYVWSHDELIRVAGDDGRMASAFYDVTPAGNWEGANVLWQPRDQDAVAAELDVTVPELLSAVERAGARLLAARESRIRPGTDDKILASWNGLAISGLAEAGRVFGRAELVDAAVAAGRFVLEELRDDDGRLLRSWRDGRTSGRGFLDDYGLVAGALLDLYETTFDESWFTAASEIVRDGVASFADIDGAGFFDTAADSERLVVRPKDVFDNAVPSGNSSMAEAMLRLGSLTGDAALEQETWRLLRALSPAMERAPTGFGHLLGALERALSRPTEVAIASNDASSAGVRRMAEIVWHRYPPNHVLAVGSSESTTVALLAHRAARDGGPTAYVCERFVCLAPISDPAALADALR